jgi:glycosyltransferase involved in cell wall biosynthesis
MPAKKTVLVDLGKLKNIYTGLGQVSWNYGQELRSTQDENLEWRFLIPKGYEKDFGSSPVTETLSSKRRYFPSLCPRYDLWHAIHQDSAYQPAQSKETKYILTIHDLIFLKEKTGSKASNRLNRLQKKADRADALVFISEYAKAEVLASIKVGDKPLHVIYNGVHTTGSALVQRPAFLPEGNFLFSIGSLIKKKNFHVLIDFMKKMPLHNLVIAGHNEGEYADFIKEKISNNGLEQRIILPGAVDDNTKAYLYENCEAFCFPSLHEGFGLPVIEAMRYGKPVFSSDLSSLPEIGGEHAFYWKNFNPEQMANVYQQGMIKFNRDQAAQSKAMIDYSNKFTWKKNVAAHIELYKEVLKLK